jgi:hypothetical protein
MKVSFYSIQGASQIVFEAENDFEKDALLELKNKDTKIDFLEGETGFCRGGFLRYWDRETHTIYSSDRKPQEIIMLITPLKKQNKESENG